MACGPATSDSTTIDAAQAKSAADMGGISALEILARKEGHLNVIAIPRDWANYGSILDAFTARYGISITSDNPDGNSQDEVNAANQLNGTSRAPDVLDVTMAVALANTSVFAPYEVATWKDIPAGQKEGSGLWFQGYGGYMSIGYDSARVLKITSLQDLNGIAFKWKVALSGDPTKANAALNAVMMASLANGGSLDNIGPGVDFFSTLSKSGNFAPAPGTSATINNGTTPVVFDWDYLSQAHGTDVPTWKVFVPSNAVLGGYFAQAINKSAPHPAAARLWEEFLYSDVGQNLWLKGGDRPVRMDAMAKAGSLDKAAAARLPPVGGKPRFLSPDQATAAKTYLANNWAQAIG